MSGRPPFLLYGPQWVRDNWRAEADRIANDLPHGLVAVMLEEIRKDRAAIRAVAVDQGVRGGPPMAMVGRIVAFIDSLEKAE